MLEDESKMMKIEEGGSNRGVNGSGKWSMMTYVILIGKQNTWRWRYELNFAKNFSSYL
jgi:hypothetical protein